MSQKHHLWQGDIIARVGLSDTFRDLSSPESPPWPNQQPIGKLSNLLPLIGRVDKDPKWNAPTWNVSLLNYILGLLGRTLVPHLVCNVYLKATAWCQYHRSFCFLWETHFGIVKSLFVKSRLQSVRLWNKVSKLLSVLSAGQCRDIIRRVNIGARDVCFLLYSLWPEHVDPA